MAADMDTNSVQVEQRVCCAREKKYAEIIKDLQEKVCYVGFLICRVYLT